MKNQIAYLSVLGALHVIAIVGVIANFSMVAIYGVISMIHIGPTMITLAGVGISVAAGALIGSLMYNGAQKYESEQRAAQVRDNSNLVYLTFDHSEQLAEVESTLSNVDAQHIDYWNESSFRKAG